MSIGKYLIGLKAWISNNKLEFFLLVAILLVAAVLRFWRIWELQFFTYDQARDALIVKRILVDHKFTLLGPQSSIPGIYLPPLYYYLMAIPLFLSGLNPVGLDIATALVGVLTVFLVWHLGNLFFGKPAGLFSAVAYATSPLVVELSRRAWNPNMMPFFILLAILSLYKIFKEKNLKFFYLLAIALGFSVNLHYSAAGIFPLALFAWIWFLFKAKDKKPIILSLVLFTCFLAPILFFEFRHNFMLTRNFSNYLFVSSKSNIQFALFESYFVSIFGIFVTLLSGSFVGATNASFQFFGKISQTIFNPTPISIVAHKPLLLVYQWWGIVLFVSIFFAITKFLVNFWKKKNTLKIGLILVLAWLLVGAFVSRVYAGKFYFFYYIFLFPSPFLLLGFTLKHFWDKNLLKLPVMFFVLFVVFFNLTHLLIFDKPERTIQEIKEAAKVIAQDASGNYTFNIAGVMRSPDRWDHNAVDYRYFVEAYFGLKALGWEPLDYRQAQKLYVVDEAGTMGNPIISPIMEIYEFAPKNIEKTWKLENGNVIYKLGK